MSDLMNGLLEDTNKAVDEATKWLDENPDFEPRFTRLFNVVLNDNEATKEMTAEVLKRAGIEFNALSFSMPHYALGVMKAHRAIVASKKESESE